MESPLSDELAVKKSIELLSSLISPFVTKNESTNNDVSGFDNVLHRNLLLVLESETFENLKSFYDSDNKWKIENPNIPNRWAFVRTCIFLLEVLHHSLSKTEDEKTKLLSVAQKKILETTFQFIVSLAIVPYLLPGVGISLEKRCSNFDKIEPESLSDFVKYRRLCFTMEALLNLRSLEVFHEIIISKHLEDILAALFQLSFVPFKKPIPDDSCEKVLFNLESLHDNYEPSNITFSLWVKMESDRKRFKEQLEKLERQIYRPLIVRNYMILLGSKETPRWMRRNLSSKLTALVLEDDGITGIIKGVIVVDESPTLSSQSTTVANLISSIFCSEDERKIEPLCSQIEKLLSSDRRQTFDYVVIDTIALAVKEMLRNNRERTEKYLIGKILRPLKQIDSHDEEEISRAILQLHNMCITPSNYTIAVPIEIIISVFPVLYSIYAHIKEGVCYLKSPIKELLGRLFLKADENRLSQLLDAAIFGDNTIQEIFRIPPGKKVVLSSNGGVSIADGDVCSSELEDGVMMLHFIKELEGNIDLISWMFVYLLKKYVTIGSEDENSATKRMIIVFLLAQLSQDSCTLRHILKNAENVIQFVSDLFNIHSEKDKQNEEVICVCLTFLTMILYDCRGKKDVNWRIFDSLLPSLAKLKKSHSPDIMLLAEEVYNLIKARNVIGKTPSTNEEKSSPLIEEIPQSPCEKAIEDACDTLLPARAHALAELTTLIKKGDVETLAKKEKIFCVFEENLKDKDSFLYLRAIEGLASLALLKPDNVLPLLCQEFSSCPTAETRLKIGEILTRIVKLLNDFMSPHKHLLINTFINGVKDDDSLVRASSLSNLGEVLLALQSNVDDILQEVIQCAQTVSLYDKDVEPRRAAVFLITSLFRGLKTTALAVLESNSLELYRTLKKILSQDSDEVVRVQAEISLRVLDDIVKDFFTVKPTMQKRINILR